MSFSTIQTEDSRIIQLEFEWHSQKIGHIVYNMICMSGCVCFVNECACMCTVSLTVQCRVANSGLHLKDKLVGGNLVVYITEFIHLCARMNPIFVGNCIIIFMHWILQYNKNIHKLNYL